jgi:hypothetical protein
MRDDWVVCFLVEAETTTTFWLLFPHILPSFHTFGHLGLEIVGVTGSCEFSKILMFLDNGFWAIFLNSFHASVRKGHELHDLVTICSCLATQVQDCFVITDDPGVTEYIRDCHSVFRFLDEQTQDKVFGLLSDILPNWVKELYWR